MLEVKVRLTNIRATTAKQTAELLNAQAVHLDVLDVSFMQYGKL